MAKIISYERLARQHHLNLLEHTRRDYQEREDYLARLRKLFFQVEGQMRQAEFQQLEIFRQLAENLKLPLKFPDLGDRVGLQELFAANPYLVTFREFLAGRLTTEECYQKIMELKKTAE
jgi:hypothetical protein